MKGGERDRGILTPADRAYLRGETQLASDQSERNARSRIRNRVRESIRDFEVLIEHLPERDRRLVFEKQFDELDGPAAYDALVSAIAFLYLGVEDTDFAVEELLGEGINVAEAKRDRSASVTFERTYHSLSTETLLDRLEGGESLSLTELAYLQRSDDLSRSELAEHLADDETEIDDGRIQAKVTNF
ncbi:hypothetical protein [Halopiger goleimassiliensis]|uniref:hypothetical protein n=1 Tax=Halopiger goleimassiliensis TaxID=1293048 RepID=UPI000677AB5B|nr:hypothetical protein [Halopiger goleimassiliensis]